MTDQAARHPVVAALEKLDAAIDRLDDALTHRLGAHASELGALSEKLDGAEARGRTASQTAGKAIERIDHLVDQLDLLSAEKSADGIR